MKTDYFAHDAVYKSRKAEGRPGWQDADTFGETLVTLEQALTSEYAPRSGKMLELGCGAGDLTLWLAEKGYEVYGVDIAPTAIDWARDKARERDIQAEFRVGNVLDLRDYPDDRFDFVLDGHCFHCIIGEDRKLFLTSARRVLKPGAFFHVSTMCGEVTSEEIRQYFDPVSRCVVRDGVASRYLGLAEDILVEVRDAGFEVLDWRVQPRKKDEENDSDMLLVWAVSP